jgi:polyferredoxin
MKVLIENMKGLQKWRVLIQVIFILLSIWIGVDFYFFNHYLATDGQAAFHSRPPGVDAYLPISGLLSLIYFFRTGVIHPVHPAGFALMISFLLMSFVFAKSFCSWVCVFGTISEKLADLGEFIFKRKIEMPKILDAILRALKYLLLIFMIIAFIGMTTPELKRFLDGNFNIICDIRMYDFFAEVSNLTILIFSIFILLSIVFRGFWCRYLCPFGALMNIMGILSPHKIKRNSASCINCTKCTEVCPSFIKVDSLKTVISDECSSCMKCIDICPVKDTLMLKPIASKKTIQKKWVMISVVVIFLGITSIAMLLGNWQNDVTKEEYLEIYPNRKVLEHH